MSKRTNNQRLRRAQADSERAAYDKLPDETKTLLRHATVEAVAAQFPDDEGIQKWAEREIAKLAP